MLFLQYNEKPLVTPIGLYMSFFPLEQLSKMYDGYQQDFNVDGHQLLLCQLEGQVFIIENRCPHMDVTLTYAMQLPGMKIRCRAHGIEFDLPSGRACGPLADTLESIKKYPVIYEGSQLGIDIG